MLKSYKKAMKSGLPKTDIEIKGTKKRGGTLYYETLVTFDIEVTNYRKSDEVKVGIPYLWVVASEEIGDWYGRTIEEYIFFIRWVKQQLPDATLVIYVHNLAYEWQFIRSYEEWDDVFLVNRRKPLTARVNGVEYRCSYMLTNKSLERFLSDSGTDLQKLDYDYDKHRFPWDEITEEELEYCYVDAKGLVLGLRKLLEMNNDTIGSVPLTSTGYVRRDVRAHLSGGEKKLIKNLSMMSLPLYTALKGSFVGGNTHANRFYAGEILNDLYCYDIASSYPHVQLTKDFPMTPFVREFIKSPQQMEENKAYAMLVEIDNISLINYFDPMPTIGVSRCLELERENTDDEIDNGRVLKAKRLVMWMTDIEYNVIAGHYKWDKCRVLRAYSSIYGQLPDGIKACIYKYYDNKCRLKGVDDYLYAKSKELLNAIYGMSAFDVGKIRYIYDRGEYTPESDDVAEILERANEAKTPPPEPYCWGVWTTAHARKSLDDAIVIAGDRFAYCDTDSVYTFGEMPEITNLNNVSRETSKNYSVEVGERVYYIGDWEKDKHCDRFVTLGAKKYAYESEGKVKTVTAGVSKKAGVKRLEDYKIGHIFKNATLKATYNDEDTQVEVDGKNITLKPNIYLEPSDYTLGVSDVYGALLEHLRGDSYVQVLYR